jgi:hypothetical protein
MPRALDSCVKKVMRKGYTKSQAYAICSTSTGWVRGKGGKWVKKKKRRKK